MADRKEEAAGDSSLPQDGKKPAPRPNQPQSAAAGIKETIESIVVAFILAFIFRAFVVEAFVIPTGSMATTLLGAHMRYDCPDCGWRFDVNFSAAETSSGDDIAIPSISPPLDIYYRYIERTTHARFEGLFCPNCGYNVVDPTSTSRPAVHYGDRILVLKYLYLFEKPQRWDVVVFKSPADYPAYAQNYIKRLVGNPGETLMILDGDIYKKTDAGWEIQTKPRAVQQAMWRLVHDNDYLPQRLPRQHAPAFRQPWTPAEGSGWNVDGRTFQFSNPTGQGAIRFDPQANPSAQTLSDYLAYDQPNAYPNRSYVNTLSNGQELAVSDLKLHLFYQRQSGDGPLRLTLGKYDDTFTAEITPRAARLLKTTAGRTTQIGYPVSLEGLTSRPLEIEFSNVDHRVTLRLNGQDAVSTTPQDYFPNVEQRMDDHIHGRTPPPGKIAIIADNQACQLSHVELSRDVYYSNSAGGREIWASPTRPVTLGADEYFVMGDNTLVSYDARAWSNVINLPDEGLVNIQSGRVPGRFMLGKAFFVYWPAGFRPLSDSNPGVVPNFGDMRFIH